MFRPSRILATVSLCLMILMPAAIAQEAEDLSGEISTPLTIVRDTDAPTFLKPVSETADLTILTQIFGDVARAAAGQISLADAMIDYNPNNPEELQANQTDSVLAAIMYTYLIGMIGIIGFMIIIGGITYLVQSGIDGQMINKQYNEWVVIRVVYAIFALMPVIGGWSIGQYGILNATFFVNSITNSMHHTANRWVYSHNSVSSLPLQGHEYKKLVENVYLSALCAEIANQYFEQTMLEVEKKKESYILRLEDKEISERGRLAVADFLKYTPSMSRETYEADYKINFISPEDDQELSSVGKRLAPPEWLTRGMAATWNIYSGQIISNGDLTAGGNEAVKFAAFMENDKHDLQYSWGSNKSAPDACGKIDFNISIGGTFTDDGDAGSQLGLGPRNKQFVKAYFRSHNTAINELINRAANAVSQARVAVEGAVSSAAISSVAPRKHPIGEAISEEALKDKMIDAVGNAFSIHATSSQLAWEELVAGETGRFLTTIRKDYSEQTQIFVSAYDYLLNELEKQQRDGSLADYKSDTSEYSNNINPTYHPLIQNSQRGWMYAGYKWWDLSRATGFQMELQKHKPVSTSFRQTQGALPENIRTKLDAYSDKYFKAKSMRRISELSQELGAPNPKDLEYIELFSQEYSGDFVGAVNKYKSALSSSVGAWLATSGIYNLKSMDLLASLQNTGHTFMVIGEGMLATAVAASVVEFGAEAVSDASGSKLVPAKVIEGVAGAIGGLLFYVGIVLFLCGFIYAVYLPMLPAMIWTFGIIGWLEKLITLIIAFPAWMAGHIIPDGDGLINGVGRQGYILLTGVLIRPPAMILSLHFAMVALGAIGFLISDFATIFMPSSQQGYMVGPFVLIGSLVVYSGFLVVVVHLILAWIYKIPDDLPAYISGGAGQHGESEGKGHLQGIGGIITQKSEQGVGAAKGAGPSKANPNLKPSSQSTTTNKDFTT